MGHWKMSLVSQGAILHFQDSSKKRVRFCKLVLFIHFCVGKPIPPNLGHFLLVWSGDRPSLSQRFFFCS